MLFTSTISENFIEYILINQSLPFCRILVDIYSHLSQVISDGEMESSANSDKYQLVLTQTYLISRWLLLKKEARRGQYHYFQIV